MDRRYLGALVIVIAAVAAVLLGEVYCYVMGVCPGSSQSYTLYLMGAMAAIVALLFVFIFTVGPKS